MNFDITSALIGVGMIVFIEYVIQPLWEKPYLKSKFDNPIINYILLGRKTK